MESNFVSLKVTLLLVYSTSVVSSITQLSHSHAYLFSTIMCLKLNQVEGQVIHGEVCLNE